MSYDQAYKKSTDSTPEKGLLKIKVFSQFKTFFEGDAESFSAVNKTGPFDILPGHANFLSLLSPGTIAVARPGGYTDQMDIDRGVIHVNANAVTVFLDI